MGLFTLVAVAAGVAALPAFSQSLPVCSGIELAAPANGSHFIGSRPIMFQWSGEPVGTASRELHLASLDGSETVIPLDGRFSDTVRATLKGDLAWAVVFLDANGKPLCTSPIGLLKAGSGGGAPTVGNSLSGPSDGAVPPTIGDTRLVVGFTNNGRLVIVLQNSSYAGQYSRLVASDTYDATAENLLGNIGLEIHGNNGANVIKGSTGSDEIFGYDGGDNLNGGAGDDVVHGGAGNDTVADPTGGDADDLRGGTGGDIVSLIDGDGNDIGYFNEPGQPGQFGDILSAEGTDTLGF
jgi:hypothetical protein